MSKVAVITGASKGIGAATARAFSDAGYDVVINYKSDDKAAAEVAKSINTNVLLVKSDVSTEPGVSKLFEMVKDKFGEIDVLVNNAGGAEEPEFYDLTRDSIVECVDLNFTSAVLCTKVFPPIVKKGGSILFTSSIYGMNFGGNPGLAIYSAQKAAIANFSQTMAEMLAPDIRCNSVSPGVTKTPAWNDSSDDYINSRLNMALQHEWVKPEEIASAFVFLATTEHANGTNIVVDAGWMKKC